MDEGYYGRRFRDCLAEPVAVWYYVSMLTYGFARQLVDTVKFKAGVGTTRAYLGRQAKRKGCGNGTSCEKKALNWDDRVSF